MRLASLLKRLGSLPARLADRDISSLSCNSKTTTPGAIFVAIDGVKDKGSVYIKEAIARGAVCVIAPERENIRDFKGIPFIRSPDTRYALAVLADEFFGHPSGRLKVCGVTGTNGKTTITYLIRAILEEAGFSCGLIGTIAYAFKDKVVPAPNTTPGALQLQSLLKQMLDSGCGYCAMEVSSHGLDQKRTEAIDFQAAVFTNLTQDHLDYHRNLENYFLAKSRLFSGLSGQALAIINADSPYSLRLKAMSRSPVASYGIKSDADFRAADLSLSLEGSQFNLRFNGSSVRIKTPLIGSHNVSNILAAVAFAVNQKIAMSDIARALEKFSGVPGRLCRISLSKRNVFVDYAHTPDALENVLGVLRQFCRQRLILVFGCGGERDRLKRPLMAAVACKYADTLVITSDNPRGEPSEEITRDIAGGISRDKDYKIILDRAQAIEYGLSLTGPKDILLIAGKGHENYQIFKDKTIEFDDAAVARECLKRRGL